MKIRKQQLGTANIVGSNIERLRKERNIKQKTFITKMQLLGVDINPTSYSKLEGQVRIATDKEVLAASQILNVEICDLFSQQDKN